MRIQTNRFLGLILLGATLAAPASAVPIVFDIVGAVSGRSSFDSTSGSVTPDNSLNGQAVTAQIVIDTDLFGAPTTLSAAGYDEIDYRSVEGGPMPISASLTVGGVSVDIAPFSGNRGYVSFYDSHGTILGCDGTCGSMTPDQWNIRTQSFETGPNGTSGLQTFYFTAAETMNPGEPDSGMTWLDFSQPVNLDLLLTLPTASVTFPPSLYLTDTIFDCTSVCRQVSALTTGMRITSLTRSSMAVPEPGTLGLLVVGFAGVMFATRRRQRALI
jgi:hypothetical protein